LYIRKIPSICMMMWIWIVSGMRSTCVCSILFSF
jgi:hypothetical protein